MYNITMGRKCRGKYEAENYLEQFEDGTFLGFGIETEELESGLSHYTTAIVELKDGKVIVTTPERIQFTDMRR